MFSRYKRRKKNNTAPPSHAGQMMNLSLFIMLLAFFIVLNSLSSYESFKADKVKRSIERVFAQNPQQEDRAPSVTPDPVKSVSEGDSFDRIEALFQAQLTSFEVTKSKSSGLMMVTLPYDDFSKAVMAAGQKDLTQALSRREARDNFFLPTLVSLLKLNNEGAQTHMEIVMHVVGNPARMQNQEPRSLEKVMARVGTFSSRLEAQEIPQKLLNIGISNGDPKVIALVFRKHIPFSPIGLQDEPNESSQVQVP